MINICQMTFLAFMMERCIRQGESTSSLVLTAMYDILLEWIDFKNKQLYSNEAGLNYSDQDALAAQINYFAHNLDTIKTGKNAVYMQKI
jgi:hypothetical protein